MKRNINKITFICAVAIMSSSCHFLEVEKIGKSDIESFFESEESVEAAVTGCMDILNGLVDDYMILYPEICGDLVVMNASESGMWSYIYNFDLSESYNTTPIGFVWNDAYELVLNACEIIDYAPQVKKSYPNAAAMIDRQVAHAHYLRAIATFYLALCYSQHYSYTADASHLGVILMSSFPNLNAELRRSDAADTYKFIISDLKKAYELYDDDRAPDPHFPSRAAVQALLARVYLYMEDYDNAVACATDVIDNYDFSLTPRDGYFDMFTTVSSRGRESIFRLNGYGENSTIGKAFDYQTYMLLPSEKLKSVFEEDAISGAPDVRKSLISYDGKPNSMGCSMKYTILEQVSDKDKAIDLFVSRLSEMYLIRAEALARLNRDLQTAADDVAIIRSRATGLAADACRPALDAGAILEAVSRERVKEFYHEGHRLFDITRRRENLERDASTTSTVRSMTYPNDDFIFPIPGIEVEANKAIQPNPNNETQR